MSTGGFEQVEWSPCISTHHLTPLSCSRVTPVLEDWEVERLRQFISRLNIGYSKLYDATNGLYLHVDDRGQLQSTPKDCDAPEMFWTRSGDRCIENYFTGQFLEFELGLFVVAQEDSTCKCKYRRSRFQWHQLQWHSIGPSGWSDTFLISQSYGNIQ